MPSIKVEDSDMEEGAQAPQEVQPEVSEPLPEAPVTPVINQKSIQSSKLLRLVVPALLVVLVAGFIWVQHDRNQLKQEVSKLSQSQKEDPADEAKDISSAVGKLIELPSDEAPTIATVIDAAKVKNQVFFANAQNGDKVLIYSKASKAILYRPSANKIIEVAPITLGQTQSQGTKTDTTTKTNR